MPRIAVTLFLCVFLSAADPAFPSEPLVVELWPGKVPGDVGIKGQETSRIHQSPLVGPTKLITNVTQADPHDLPASPGKEHRNGDDDLSGRRLLGPLLGARGRRSGGLAQFSGHDRASSSSTAVRGAPGEIRTEPPLGPQLDAQRAVSLVRSRAAEWGIDPKRIGIVGFSAGGHLALATATGFNKRKYEPIDAVDQVSCRPDFAIGCYSGYLKAKDKNELAPGIQNPGRHAADLPGPRLRRQPKLRRLVVREQRDHVPRLETRRRSGRAAHLRGGRPRLRRAAEREAPLELDAALRQMAARPASAGEADRTQMIAPRAARRRVARFVAGTLRVP